MIVNALLIRWAGGWAERADDASIEDRGRREGFLSLGALQSIPEVNRVADQQLAIYGAPRSQIAGEIVPRVEADMPYLAFRPRDFVTMPDRNGVPSVERVRSITVSDDINGELKFSVEVKDLILTDRERFDLQLTKMADGTLEGTSKVATPVAPPPDTPSSCCVPTPPEGGGGIG